AARRWPPRAPRSASSPFVDHPRVGRWFPEPRPALAAACRRRVDLVSASEAACGAPAGATPREDRGWPPASRSALRCPRGFSGLSVSNPPTGAGTCPCEKCTGRAPQKPDSGCPSPYTPPTRNEDAEAPSLRYGLVGLLVDRR